MKQLLEQIILQRFMFEFSGTSVLLTFDLRFVHQSVGMGRSQLHFKPRFLFLIGEPAHMITGWWLGHPSGGWWLKIIWFMADIPNDRFLVGGF